ncbi:hypothetical protein [Microlunatus parietis]|uniref:hypothetical protein n=1 Tax=Microlunatus parietis TaxID=682979 RepID=UPI0015CD6F79|nr:hypothetical protein [Microlunatus parietis]
MAETEAAVSVSQATFAGAEQLLSSRRNPELPSRSGTPGNDVVIGSRSLVLARMGR